MVGLYKVSVFITNPSAIDGTSKNETVTSLFSGKHSSEISGKSNCAIVGGTKRDYISLRSLILCSKLKRTHGGETIK